MAPFSDFKKRSMTFCRKVFRKFKPKPKPMGHTEWKQILDEAALEMKRAIPTLKDEIYKCEKEAAVLLATNDVQLASNMMRERCRLDRKISFCKQGQNFARLLAENVKTLLEDIECPSVCPMHFRPPLACLCYAAAYCDELPSLAKFKRVVSKKYFFGLSDGTFYPDDLIPEVANYFVFPQPDEYQMGYLLCDLAVRYKVYQTDMIPPDLKAILLNIEDDLYQ